MELSDAQKQEMIAATHDSAVDMVDDLQHIREVIAKPEPTAGDIRRTSNILRRLLIDNNGDLRKIAPPRIGKTHLFAPDLTLLYRSGDKHPWGFLSTARAKIFGIQIDAVLVDHPPVRRSIAGYDPDKTVSLTFDQFNRQRVICFQGKWVTRRDVITYVANVGGGVHSGDPKEPVHELIRKIRHAATIKLENDEVKVTFNINTLALDDKMVVDRNAIDFILLHLISAAQHLTASPDVLRLEKVINYEAPPR
jgi:hypothetical protein